MDQGHESRQVRHRALILKLDALGLLQRRGFQPPKSPGDHARLRELLHAPSRDGLEKKLPPFETGSVSTRAGRPCSPWFLRLTRFPSLSWCLSLKIEARVRPPRAFYFNSAGSSGWSALTSWTAFLWQTRMASGVSTTTRFSTPQRAMRRPLETAMLLWAL